jgi:hypothetical protein
MMATGILFGTALAYPPYLFLRCTDFSVNTFLRPCCRRNTQAFRTFILLLLLFITTYYV